MLNNKIDNFVHLHLHDTYSYTDGFGLPKQYVKRALEIGQKSLGSTNHGNVSNHFKWYKECNKSGIKPILGCELYIIPDSDSTKKYNHITVLALNNEGYLNLLKIVTESWKNIHHRKPLVNMEFVIQNQKGLVITSGCLGGKISQFLVNGQIEKAETELLYYKNNIEHFYVEIIPLKFIDSKIIEQLYNLSKKLNIPMVATMDCHYVKKEQAELQEMLLCIQSNDIIENPKRWKFDQDDFYLKTREEMEQSFKEITPDLDFTEAFDNTVKIAEMVNFEFPKATPLKFPMPDEEKQKMFHKICMEGMKYRNLIGKKEYEERMEYEYELIVKKDFIDYFLVVTDIVKWAKNNDILVGPARGSSAGSLICYILKITEVDPIKYDLMFERFMDINREDLPDIDVDFEDIKKPVIINYLKEKYGTDKISAIATFSTFKGKNTISDIGRIFRIPFEVINNLKKIIIERSGGDSRASLTIKDSFEQFDTAKEYIKQYPSLKYAEMFEGQIRNMGSHASGIIINNEPLVNFCALYQVNGESVTSVDYNDASELGLVKLDILGLNTLTCVQKALKLIKERIGKEIDIYNIPLDDKKIYKGFQDPKKLFGIFQFDGIAVNQVCRQMKPENFEELVAINALSRPGPMHGRDLELDQPITSVYIARKWNQIPKKFAHPLLESITDETQGVIIYQEQVMKVMREIGSMSWKDTGDIRKNISRSRGIEAFNEYKVKFTIGAKENGLTDFEIDNIWAAVCSHGSWCISGDTKIRVCGQNSFVKNKLMTVKELFDNNGYATPKWKYQPDVYKKVKILSVDFDGKIRPARIKNIYYNGIQETREIITENGKRIKATKNHKFLTNNGYLKVSELKVGDLIAVNGGYEQKEYIKTAKGQGWTKGLKWKNGKQPIIDGRSVEIENFKIKNTNKPCDHCSEYNKRMEIHHITRNAPNSIFEWLCPSCHKKTEYKKGRTKVWQKGYSVKFEKINRIAKYKNKKRAYDVYDIEMEDNNKPNFVANDFISHNSFNKSHSVSYSMISYWTMFLKIYYPIEYYAAMASTMNNEGKVKRVIKEYLREGFELLPIDINKSDISFVIDDNKLRLGFTQIKGIGQSVTEKIMNGQPYYDIEDFEKRSKIGKKNIELLAKMGAFKPIGGTTTFISSLFGITENIKYIETIDMEEKLKICPLSVDFNIFEQWSDFISEHIKFPLSKIEEVNPEINSQVIIGIVYDKNLKDKIEEAVTRGRPAPIVENGLSKFCNFTLEDDTDFVTIRISPRNFPSFKSLIFEEMTEGDVLMIKGRMGDGIRMFFMNEVLCLNHLRDKIEGKTKVPYTESELVMMGKLWRKIPKRSNYHPK